MNIDLVLEISSVISSLIFLYFLMKENKCCWIFGIISSFLSVVFFYRLGLLNESLLYFFYALMGFYGFYKWNSEAESSLKIKSIVAPLKHGLWILSGLLLAGILFYFTPWMINGLFENPPERNDSLFKKSYDALTTSFGFIATFLEAFKILQAWIYWIVLNGLSIGLYLSSGAYIYALLMVVFFVFSFIGYFAWRKKVEQLQ